MTGVFYNQNSKIKGDIVIPEGVTVIEMSAFYNSDFIKNVILPQSLVQIDENAFMYCESLERIVIPESVTKVGDSAFRECKSLIYAKVPVSTIFLSHTILGKKAFYKCESLTTLVLYGNTTEIGEYKISNFIADSNITEIVIEAPVTLIDDKAFYNCKDLKSIVVPETIQRIEYNAFQNQYCNSLERVQIMKTSDEIKSMFYYPWGATGKIYDKYGNLVQ